MLGHILEGHLAACKDSLNENQESNLAAEIFNFERDFYQNTEKKPFWGFDRSQPHIMTATMVLQTLCFAAKFVLNFLVALIGSLPMCTSLTLRAKLGQMTKCERYYNVLSREKAQLNGNMFDHHFHRMAMFSMFASLLTQIFVDMGLGLILIFVLHTYSGRSLDFMHWATDGLTLQVLQD